MPISCIGEIGRNYCFTRFLFKWSVTKKNKMTEMEIKIEIKMRIKIRMMVKIKKNSMTAIKFIKS